MLTKTAEMMKVLKMITEERMSALPTSKARHGAGKGSGKLTIGGTRSYVLTPQWLRPMVKLARAKFVATFRSDWDEVDVDDRDHQHPENPHDEIVQDRDQANQYGGDHQQPDVMVSDVG
jgi:hypothetical protein